MCPVVEEILPKFLLLLLDALPALLLVFILTGFGPLQITTKIILDFRQRAEIVAFWPKSAPFSYTCPNFQLFLGKSNAFLTILKNRVRSRTLVQTFVFLILPSLIYQAWSP